MPKRIKMMVVASIAIFFCSSLEARGRSRGQENLVRNLPGSMAFASFGDAPWQNPSLLVADDPMGYLDARYSPQSPDSAAHQSVLSASLVGKKIGIGGMVEQADLTGFDPPLFTLGVGLRIPKLELGAGVRFADPLDGTFPDAVFSIQSSHDTARYGIIFRAIDQTAILDLGIGFTNEENYSIELKVSLPTFYRGTVDPNYLVVVTGNIYEGPVGFGIQSQYDISTNTDTHMVSGLLSFSEDFKVRASLELPGKRWWAVFQMHF